MSNNPKWRGGKVGIGTKEPSSLIHISEFDSSVLTSDSSGNACWLGIVGTSNKGPVNMPVHIRNAGEMVAFFGSPNKIKEEKGEQRFNDIDPYGEENW